MYLELNKELTPEQIALKNETHRFAAEVLRPASIELDKVADPEDVIKKGSPMWDVFKKSYELGHHIAGFPEELGGVSLGPLERHIIAEENGWASADFAIALGVSGFPFSFAAMSGNPDLIKNVLIPYTQDREGKYIGCWAITEPAHGSDGLLIGAEQFRDPKLAFDVSAKLDGDEWVINGQKAAWVSNGTIATHALLFVCIDPSLGMAGSGVCVVPLDLPGVSRGKPLNKIGQRALNQGEIYFDDVRIPKDYMIVYPPAYPLIADQILAAANAGMGAIFTGVARAAFEEALTYCKERIQGGKPICEHQVVQMKLFDMFIKVETSRAISRAAMIYNATTIPPATHYSIVSKVYCTTAAFEVASEAIQLFGGMGLSKEMLIEKIFRDARASMIEDGCNEVLSLAATRHLIDKYTP
ncbi:MAG: acyl-CoA dehydrogenase family protein [Dehalococcoidia bacterium]